MNETSFSGSPALWAGGFIKRIRLWFIRRGLRSMMLVYSVLMQMAKWIGPSKRHVGKEGYDILLTGAFYSDNWISSHLRPLAMSKRCARVRMVANSTVPKIDNVEAIYPPPWLVSILGAVPARLLTFAYMGVRRRPHFIGGFHLLVNGLVAALLAKILGSRSLYFCGGGPREVVGGGYSTENRLFRKLRSPDEVIEKQLLKAVSEFDLVVTMGNSAIKYFQNHGVNAEFHVVAGGKDSAHFYPTDENPTADLILVGRLSQIKRVDIFIKAIMHAQVTLPNISAIIVGDGPIRDDLEQLASDLKVEGNIQFVGQQSNIEEWLRKAKVFVLTSDSEGLSLALMEAMMCGLPAVVSNVGDLGDLIEDGINGFLINEHTPEAFANRFVELLEDEEKFATFKKATQKSARRYETHTVSLLWDKILAPNALEREFNANCHLS